MTRARRGSASIHAFTGVAIAFRAARLVAPLPAALLLSGCGEDSPTAPEVRLVATAGTGAPIDLWSLVSSSSRIELAWTDATANETGFEVHRSSTGVNGALTLVATTVANQTAFSQLGLEPSSQHCFTVRAVRVEGDRRGHSGFSNIVCATTHLPPPAAPSNLAVASAARVLVVTWADNSTSETTFLVQRSTTGVAPWSTIDMTGPGATSVRDSSVMDEQQYCYQVAAAHSTAQSSPSNVACTALPRTPSLLVAAAKAAGSIDLTWRDASNVEDGYAVLRATSDLAFSVVATLPANATSYSDAAPAVDTRYWYRVRALNDGGHSEVSGAASALLPSATPAAPSRLVAYAFNSTSVWVEWTDESALEEGFRVERSSDGGSTWTAIRELSFDQRAMQESGRVPDQRVCYRMRAFNVRGQSPPSETSCALPPIAPVGLTAAVVRNDAIELRWTDRSAVEHGFEIRIIECSDYYGYQYCYAYPIGTTQAGVTSWLDAPLARGTTRTYEIVAFTLDGDRYSRSDASNQVTATTP